MSLGENSLVAAYQGKGQLKSRPSGTRVVTLCNIVGQMVEEIISKMADGGHFGFGALAELAHTFARGMGAKFVI